MASLTRWTWVWASSRSWWWTGKPGMMQSMGSHSWAWLSDWTDWLKKTIFLPSPSFFSKPHLQAHFPFCSGTWSAPLVPQQRISAFPLSARDQALPISFKATQGAFEICAWFAKISWESTGSLYVVPMSRRRSYGWEDPELCSLWNVSPVVQEQAEL